MPLWWLREPPAKGPGGKCLRPNAADCCCAEWHVDAADQSYHFYFDGTEVLGFTKGAGNYKDSELPNSFAEVRLGWNNYQSAPPGFTAWIDDFAVDDMRVGCAK